MCIMYLFMCLFEFYVLIHLQFHSSSVWTPPECYGQGCIIIDLLWPNIQWHTLLVFIDVLLPSSYFKWNRLYCRQVKPTVLSSSEIRSGESCIQELQHNSVFVYSGLDFGAVHYHAYWFFLKVDPVENQSQLVRFQFLSTRIRQVKNICVHQLK